MTADTVTDDGAVDKFFGYYGHDWFIDGVGDNIVDPTTGIGMASPETRRATGYDRLNLKKRPTKLQSPRGIFPAGLCFGRGTAKPPIGGEKTRLNLPPGGRYTSPPPCPEYQASGKPGERTSGIETGRWEGMP
ncbi:MAG: hypothetical protein U0903_15590 [Planctomycetales bacterium]